MVTFTSAFLTLNQTRDVYLEFWSIVRGILRPALSVFANEFHVGVVRSAILATALWELSCSSIAGDT